MGSRVMKQEAALMAPGLLELPEPVLLNIMVVHTDLKSKRAARHSCRALRQLLDSNMKSVCLKHTYENHLAWGWVHDSWVKTIKTSSHLTTLVTGQALNDQLPINLKALKCQIEAWPGLSRLRNLEVLCVERQTFGGYGRGKEIPYWLHPKPPVWGQCGLEGRPQFHFLTSLRRLELVHETTLVGSLAALAPTLQHLEIEAFNQVHHVEQLTNLEVLIVRKFLPRDFFTTHKLPIKHLEWYEGNIPFDCALSWKDAPTTLESVCSHSQCADFVPGVLPSTVTCLQPLTTKKCLLADIALALPGVQRLDYMPDWGDVETVSKIQKFKQLKFLNIVGSYPSDTVMQMTQAALGEGAIVDRHRNTTTVLRHRYTWPEGIH